MAGGRARVMVGLATGATSACLLIAPSGATALTTIGQQPPSAPPSSGCAGASSDFIQPNVAVGNPYVVPAGSDLRIASFSTFAGPGTGQIMTAKVFRLVSGTTYKVVAHDGPLNLNPGVVNTFKTNIPVQPGDVLGLSHATGSSISCRFTETGQTGGLESLFTDLQDSQSANFSPSSTGSTLNLSATVGTPPSNDFSFGKVKKIKTKGTAVLTVDVPGPGTLTLSGPGLKTQRIGGATISKAVTAAGPVHLKVKAKGHKKTKLLDTGKVKVKASVTFTPSGDLPGVAKTDTKPLKLVDNG